MKILILDDDPFVLKLLSMQLRARERDGDAPFETLACERSADALALAAEHRRSIALIFCDLQMPEMDGIQVVRHLVRIGYKGALVLISGEDRRTLLAAEGMARAHGLRVLGALEKPIAPGQLDAIFGQISSGPPAPGSTSRTYLPTEIEAAIRNRELINHYQPKVEIATGKVVGVEALVRWQHPRDGLVMPYQFIPIAERHGLINRLTDAVLTLAFEHAAQWSRDGHPLGVAVNVAMSNLVELDFPDVLAQFSQHFGVPLENISLEITEGQLMTEPRSQLDVLTRLRLKRTRLSIDDFGIGYSGMAQLRDLPFDELKVDRSFVHGASDDPSLRAILDASLGLARQLGMQSVGEGVENLADWICLRDAGCHLAQGYFIARPMPADQVAGWIKDWSTRYAALAGATEATV
jgi:EAL domain-containing protein (putative c-di-GMP-specific phosphodiesterase class I)